MLSALTSLALQFELGGSVGVKQFLFGFGLIGKLSQRFNYHRGIKEDSAKPSPSSKIFRPGASRFADRPIKSGRQNAHLLPGEAFF